jgi:ribonuclease VapC
MSSSRSAAPTLPVSSSAAASLVVLDASAVLALLFKEPGAEVVCAHLRTGVIGAANLAEVLAKLADHGLPTNEAARAVAILGLEIMPMTETQALHSAALRPVTRSAGLSLGDRACLALAAELGAVALTADRGWNALAGPVGVRVQMIR